MSEPTRPLAIYLLLVLVNVRVKDKVIAQADGKAYAAIKAVADKLGDPDRTLVREYGTESLFFVTAEVKSEETCRNYVNEVAEVIKYKAIWFKCWIDMN